MGNPTDLLPSLDPANAPLSDSLPPAYSEHDLHHGTTDQSPQYEASWSNQITGSSETLQGSTRIFPPVLNGYFHWKSTTTFHLGPTAEEKLFAVSLPAGLFNNKPSLILHNGPTKQDATLATSRSDKWGRLRPMDITLYPHSANNLSAEFIVQMIPSSTSHTSAAFTFEINTGGKGTDRQRFEWRSSHGTEIKQLAGHSYGYKLVWLSGPTIGAGGSRKERNLGMSSDGLEIVAVIAHNASMSMTKGFRFNYTGTGLTGTLGADWEVMTLISALQLWLLDVLGLPTAGTAPTSNAASS